MGKPMVFSPQQIEEIKMLGTMVIYRPHSKALGPYQVAMIVSYDNQTGVATLILPGGTYHVSEVPYSKNLSEKNTWCFKNDVAPAETSSIPTPANDPNPVEPQPIES